MCCNFQEMIEKAVSDYEEMFDQNVKEIIDSISEVCHLSKVSKNWFDFYMDHEMFEGWYGENYESEDEVRAHIVGSICGNCDLISCKKNLLYNLKWLEEESEDA